MSGGPGVCITCDVCETAQGHGPDATEARAYLRQWGWERTADGGDICEACVGGDQRRSVPDPR